MSDETYAQMRERTKVLALADLVRNARIAMLEGDDRCRACFRCAAEEEVDERAARLAADVLPMERRFFVHKLNGERVHRGSSALWNIADVMRVDAALLHEIPPHEMAVAQTVTRDFVLDGDVVHVMLSRLR